MPTPENTENIKNKVVSELTNISAQPAAAPVNKKIPENTVPDLTILENIFKPTVGTTESAAPQTTDKPSPKGNKIPAAKPSAKFNPASSASPISPNFGANPTASPVKGNKIPVIKGDEIDADDEFTDGEVEYNSPAYGAQNPQNYGAPFMPPPPPNIYGGEQIPFPQNNQFGGFPPFYQGQPCNSCAGDPYAGADDGYDDYADEDFIPFPLIIAGIVLLLFFLNSKNDKTPETPADPCATVTTSSKPTVSKSAGSCGISKSKIPAIPVAPKISSINSASALYNAINASKVQNIVLGGCTTCTAKSLTASEAALIQQANTAGASKRFII
jgi:hypothetical protein